MAFLQSVDVTDFLSNTGLGTPYVSDGSAVYTDSFEIDLLDYGFSTPYVTDGSAVYTDSLEIDILDYEFSTPYVADGSAVYTNSAIEYLNALPSVPGDTGQVIVFGFTMDFVGTPRRIDLGDIVSFESLVYGPEILQYTWNFGDGTISHAKNPSHQYTSPGYYDVWLTCVDITGQVVTIKKTNYIFVNSYVFDFIGIPTSGPARLKVKFQIVFRPL